MAPSTIHIITPWMESPISNTSWEMVCPHPTEWVVLPSSDNVIMGSHDKNLDLTWRATTKNMANQVPWTQGRGTTTPHQQTRKSNNNMLWNKNHTHRQRPVQINCSRDQPLSADADNGLHTTMGTWIVPQGGATSIARRTLARVWICGLRWLFQGQEWSSSLDNWRHWLNNQAEWAMPGHLEDHSSFHSELARIVRVLYTLTFWPPTTIRPAFWLACNGLSVISQISAQQPINPTKPHSDLLAAAWMLIQTSDYQIDLLFVWGHQDTGQAMVLTRDAWLNIEVDLLAKNKATIPYTGLLIYKLPGNLWGCYRANKCMVKQLNNTLQTFVNGKECLEYWKNQKNLGSQHLKEVDWMPLGKAMRGVPLAWHWWASKHMSGHFAHGKNMVR